MSVWSLPRQRSVFQRYRSENIYHIYPSFTHRWRRKPADIEITLLSLYVYDVRFVTKACGKFDFSSELAQHSFCDDRQVDGKACDDGRVSTEQRDDDQRRHAER